MNRQNALEALKQRAPALQQMGARSMYLFGSTAKNTTTRNSDLDIFIDTDARRPFTLFELVKMQAYLKRHLKTPVDLTTRNSLHPRLRASIIREAIKVF